MRDIDCTNHPGGRILFSSAGSPTTKERAMYVVAGVTGNTGSVVASTLLERGAKVRVVVRDGVKGEAWKARGADVAIASIEDPIALAKAIDGAEGVYGLIPPDLAHPDPMGRMRRIVDAWLDAIESSRPARVVFLSSIGAQHADGTGPIRSAHYAEERLRAQRVPTTFVRAAAFLENWASAIAPAKAHGVLPTFNAPDRPYAQVATADIGRVAAEALLASAPAHRTIHLAGPADLSPAEIAAILARILGRDVKPALVPGARIAPTLTDVGVSPAMADLFREMSLAGASGLLTHEAPPTRGIIEAETVLRQLAR
jgi:uncharacterized protein YbjT (DUF2867 family)